MTEIGRRASLAEWLGGARLRTLPLAFGPVLLGSASAWLRDGFDPVLAGLSALVAVFLQVGVNYANDYSDGVRGTDSDRVGPKRLTGSGLVPPELVKRAAILCFGFAVVAGGVLIVLTAAWWMLVVGVFAVWAAWTYTGGTRPYGYRGLGELVVFVFFGPVATLGTAYVQLGFLPVEAWLTGSAIGFFASAVLLENNLRDRETDRVVGKRTLSVLMGATGSKALITFFLISPYGLFLALEPSIAGVVIGLAPALLTTWVLLVVWRATSARQLIVALQLTSMNSLMFAVSVSVALLV